MKFNVYFIIDNSVNNIIIEEQPSKEKNNLRIPKYIFRIAEKALHQINKYNIFDIDFCVKINDKIIWFNGQIKKMSDICKYDQSNSLLYKINIIHEPKEKKYIDYVTQYIKNDSKNFNLYNLYDFNDVNDLDKKLTILSMQ